MYMTVKEASSRWGISDRRVRVLCSEGKIPGAYQEGRGWKIPIDAEKPADGRFRSKESILAQMRADTSWIHELDSLAQIAIGPGAKCIDPVWHTFSYGGRTWFFNQDWGGVLEIPTDYIPEDDLWQAELSFHGTSAWSPDTLILVSFYAGFQGITNEESIEATISELEEEGFAVLERDEKEKVFTVRARSAEGIN